MTLPRDPTGYAVEESTGVVHKRYADHAKGIRRTTESGVYAVLGDVEPKPCQVCWPPVKKRPARKSTPAYVPSFIEHQPADDLTVTSHSLDLTDTHGGS